MGKGNVKISLAIIWAMLEMPASYQLTGASIDISQAITCEQIGAALLNLEVESNEIPNGETKDIAPIYRRKLAEANRVLIRD